MNYIEGINANLIRKLDLSGIISYRSVDILKVSNKLFQNIISVIVSCLCLSNMNIMYRIKILFMNDLYFKSS